MNEPLLGVLPAVAIAFAIGYELYWLAAPKESAATAVQLGRKWYAWVALGSTVTLFPKVLCQPFSINSLAIWLIIGLVVFGGIAFLLGWAYGKFRFRKSRAHA
jgi:hypothetical protein